MCEKSITRLASLAQLVEQSAVNRKVTGSSPVGSVDFIFYYLKQKSK